MKSCSHKELDKTTINNGPQQLAYIATQDEIFYMSEKSLLKNCLKGSLSSTAPSCDVHYLFLGP